MPRINQDDNAPISARYALIVDVGQEPACKNLNPTGAIHFGSKQDMKTSTQERVSELNTRGYHCCWAL